MTDSPPERTSRRKHVRARTGDLLDQVWAELERSHRGAAVRSTMAEVLRAEAEILRLRLFSPPSRRSIEGSSIQAIASRCSLPVHLVRRLERKLAVQVLGLLKAPNGAPSQDETL